MHKSTFGPEVGQPRRMIVTIVYIVNAVFIKTLKFLIRYLTWNTTQHQQSENNEHKIPVFLLSSYCACELMMHRVYRSICKSASFATMCIRTFNIFRVACNRRPVERCSWVVRSFRDRRFFYGKWIWREMWKVHSFSWWCRTWPMCRCLCLPQRQFFEQLNWYYAHQKCVQIYFYKISTSNQLSV